MDAHARGEPRIVIPVRSRREHAPRSRIRLGPLALAEIDQDMAAVIRHGEIAGFDVPEIKLLKPSFDPGRPGEIAVSRLQCPGAGVEPPLLQP